MTATDQDVHANRAIRWLTGQVQEICPPSLLADPHAWAERIITTLRVEHWKCIPPAPPIAAARQSGTPASAHASAHADELDAVRKACEAASSKHHSKEIPNA